MPGSPLSPPQAEMPVCGEFLTVRPSTVTWLAPMPISEPDPVWLPSMIAASF